MSGSFCPRQQALRRFCDGVCAAAGLLVLSPVLALLALLILLFDGRPVLFSQMRVGRYGKEFRIWKFRTMRCGPPGSAITVAGDARVTTLGRLLRKFKLDELPQLFNVVRGEMTLVGPRPEAPEYVNRESLLWRAVLLVRPGITDLATLVFRNEETLLASCDNVDSFYRETVLPAKLLLNLKYLRTRSFLQDALLIWLSIRYSLSPKRFDPDRVRRAFDTGTEHVGYTYSFSSTVDR
jgi:lipopolysaccharide/colanic/teichoic acid biosynthesis glycosyltransferase